MVFLILDASLHPIIPPSLFLRFIIRTGEYNIILRAQYLLIQDVIIRNETLLFIDKVIVVIFTLSQLHRHLSVQLYGTFLFRMTWLLPAIVVVAFTIANVGYLFLQLMSSANFLALYHARRKITLRSRSIAWLIWSNKHCWFFDLLPIEISFLFWT